MSYTTVDFLIETAQYNIIVWYNCRRAHKDFNNFCNTKYGIKLFNEFFFDKQIINNTVKDIIEYFYKIELKDCTPITTFIFTGHSIYFDMKHCDYYVYDKLSNHELCRSKVLEYISDYNGSFNLHCSFILALDFRLKDSTFYKLILNTIYFYDGSTNFDYLFELYDNQKIDKNILYSLTCGNNPSNTYDIINKLYNYI